MNLITLKRDGITQLMSALDNIQHTIPKDKVALQSASNLWENANSAQ